MIKETTHHDRPYEEKRRWLWRYSILTLSLVLPLLLAFISIRDIYPFAASKMMLGLGDSQSGRDYYVLRGETVSGEIVDLPPIQLTNALTGRNWSLVSTAVENKSFKIRWPHPENARLAASFGGAEKLSPSLRLDDLLRAWGEIYNARLPQSSNQRLRSVRLDKYTWEGGIEGEFDRFVESWRTLL